MQNNRRLKIEEMILVGSRTECWVPTFYISIMPDILHLHLT